MPKSVVGEDLIELTKFVGWIGNGIHTFPNGDENNKKIFAECVELEGLGLVYRFIDEPEHVYFKLHDYREYLCQSPL